MCDRVEQRGDGDFGEVVGVDEWLADGALDHRQGAGGDLLGPERLGEVLEEERRTQDGPLGAGRDERGLRLSCSVLAAAGQEHETRASEGDGAPGERTQDGVGAREADVRLEGEVGGGAAREGALPGRVVVPVEPWARCGG